MLRKSNDHRSPGIVLTPFKVVDASAKNTVRADALNSILRAEVVRKHFGYDHEPQLCAELPPFLHTVLVAFALPVPGQDDGVSRRRHNRPILIGHSAADVDQH